MAVLKIKNPSRTSRDSYSDIRSSHEDSILGKCLTISDLCVTLVFNGFETGIECRGIHFVCTCVNSMTKMFYDL